MIYFVRAGETEHVKIGWTKTAESLPKRLKVMQTGIPHRLVLLRTIEAKQWVEIWLHGFYSGVRTLGKWFIFQDDMMTIEPPLEPPAVEGIVLQKPPTRKFTFNLPLPEAAALDAICREQRRATGNDITYTDLIIRALVVHYRVIRDARTVSYDPVEGKS